jgi:hypothetical protein
MHEGTSRSKRKERVSNVTGYVRYIISSNLAYIQKISLGKKEEKKEKEKREKEKGKKTPAWVVSRETNKGLGHQPELARPGLSPSHYFPPQKTPEDEGI